MNAGELLLAWRKRRKLTQEKAADLVGVRQATWSEYEHGKKIPRTRLALKIAKLTRGAVPVTAWADGEAL